MSNEITKQLLKEILNLQEQLVEEKQKNKNLKTEEKRSGNCISYLRKEIKEQEEKRKDEMVYAFLGGIGFIVFLYLLVKFCIYFFF